MYTMIPSRRSGDVSRSFFPDSLLNDHFFRSFFDMNDWMGNAGFRVDIRDKKDRYLLEAELPGVQENDITLTAENDLLTITADIRTQQEDSAYYSERRAGRVTRSFRLDGIDEEKISAEYQNGILTVTLPKQTPEQEENHQRRIPIGHSTASSN